MFLLLTQVGNASAPVAINVDNIVDIRPTYASKPESGTTIFTVAAAGDRTHSVSVQETFDAVARRLGVTT